MKASSLILAAVQIVLSLQYHHGDADHGTSIQQRISAGNTGCFVTNLIIRNNAITHQSVNSEQGCLELCKQYPNCGAVMMDSVNAVCYVFASGYRATHEDHHNIYRSAERTCFDKAPSQDTGNLFQLVDSSGNYITGQQKGLLLYNGGTVCNSNFNGTAAHAVCKLMGFKGALTASSGQIWKIQEKYKVFLHGLACSERDWSSCTFSSDGNVCNDHTKDMFLTCSGDRSPFNLVNFSGSQVSGHQQFLLLYNGGTVCGDHFSDNSAHAICRDMGYFGAKGWRMGQSSWFSGTSQVEYHIALDDVSCTRSDWKSCSYTTSHNCVHGQVIYLSCILVPDYSSSTNTDENTSMSTTFVTLICIGLVVIVLRKNSQIDLLTKKSAETETLNKKLQDQLFKELQKDSKTSLKTDSGDSSGGEYHNVNGPD